MKRFGKKIFAVVLSAALIVPTSVAGLGGYTIDAAEVPTPALLLDFEANFKGEKTKNDFAVVESKTVLNYVSTETANEDGSTTYEYDYTAPWYNGQGSEAKYAYGVMANTPSTAIDAEMGEVLWMQNDYSVEQFVKTEPANYTSTAEDGTTKVLETENKTLDETIPPYTAGFDSEGKPVDAAAYKKALLQEPYTYYPQVKTNNPFKGVDLATTGGATINYWIKLTPSADNEAVAEDTTVINFRKDETIMYSDPAGPNPLEDPTSTVGYGFVNGICQFMANGSLIFTTDDGTAMEMNDKNENYGSIVGYDTDNNYYLSFEGKALSDYCKPGEWHMVTIQINDEGIKYYYDGELDTEAFKEDSGTSFTKEGLLTWLSDEDTYLTIGGSNETMLSKHGIVSNVTDFKLDDLSCYTEVLNQEQISELFNQGKAKMTYNTAADKDLPDSTTITFDSADKIDVSMRANNVGSKSKIAEPEVVKDIRMGSVVHAFKGQTTEASGAKITTNPFAGKTLSGATVSYWMKTNEAVESVGLSFIDGKKEMYHSKMQATAQNTLAYSILYAKNNGFAAFIEGSSDAKVPDTLKNQTYRALTDENTTAQITKNGTEWHLYTMVITNSGIEYYIDSEKIADEAIDNIGPRFFDGYYQRMYDTRDNNLIYGGSGNYGATSIMTFLTYEDTAMYLAYANTNMSESTFQVCTEAYFGDVICFDEALDASQVAKLYTQQAEKYPEVKGTKGDVNGDNKADAKDALAILKHSAKIAVLTDDLVALGDVTNDGKADAQDALKILRHVAGLVESLN